MKAQDPRSLKLEFVHPDARLVQKYVMEYIREDDKSPFLEEKLRGQFDKYRTFSTLKSAISSRKGVILTTSRIKLIKNFEKSQSEFSKMTSFQKDYIRNQFNTGRVDMPLTLCSRKDNSEWLVFGSDLLQYCITIKRKPATILRIMY